MTLSFHSVVICQPTPVWVSKIWLFVAHTFRSRQRSSTFSASADQETQTSWASHLEFPEPVLEEASFIRTIHTKTGYRLNRITASASVSRIWRSQICSSISTEQHQLLSERHQLLRPVLFVWSAKEGIRALWSVPWFSRCQKLAKLCHAAFQEPYSQLQA